MGAFLNANSLSLTGGNAVVESGGAIRSQGAFYLDRCDVSTSTASGAGASGGGIFNQGGTFFATRTRIFDCAAERAGGAIEANGGSTRLERSEFVDNMTGAAPGNGGAVHLTGAGLVDVSLCQFRGNTATREGGALWSSATGTMTVSLSDFNDNAALGAAADDGGGALFNDGGTLTLGFCELVGNSATGAAGSGGGIFNNNGTLNVTLFRLIDNVSNRAGGGIECLSGTTHLMGNIFRADITGPSPGNGGGLHLTGAGMVTIQRCFFAENIASAEGGGVWNSAVGTMNVTGSAFVGNEAQGAAADQGGGGLFNDGGVLTVQGTSVYDNLATGTSGSGGGLLNVGGNLSVSDSRIQFNSASRAGGGVEANLGMTSLSRVVLSNNETGPMPGNGGGLHLTGGGTVTIDRCRVLGNDATNEGGGLWSSATGTMTVTGSSIHGNMAPVGREVFNVGGNFTINGVPVAPGH